MIRKQKSVRLITTLITKFYIYVCAIVNLVVYLLFAKLITKVIPNFSRTTAPNSEYFPFIFKNSVQF